MDDPALRSTVSVKCQCMHCQAQRNRASLAAFKVYVCVGLLCMSLSSSSAHDDLTVQLARCTVITRRRSDRLELTVTVAQRATQNTLL